LQLSRITHRKGLTENLPQLKGAEFGWALDQRRLFIGNGTLVDGAPVIGNTEILTQFSDILSGKNYTYAGLSGGYQVDTGGNGIDILRSLQSKFDDIASAKDFGVTGQGLVDDTEATNRALFELFCRDGDTLSTRRSLFFPAGTYLINDTIKIPPNAKIYGEGHGSTVFVYSKRLIDNLVGVTDEVSSGVYQLSEIMPPGYSPVVILNGTILVETTDYTVVGDVLTFTVAPVLSDVIDAYFNAPYVVTTSDSVHAIDISMGSDPLAILPSGIEMTSLAFETTENNHILFLNSVVDSYFDNIRLKGPQVNLSATSGAALLDTSAIEIASLVGTVTTNINFSKMNTTGTTFAMRSTDNAKNVNISGSKFDNHWKGIFLDRKNLNPIDPDYLKFPVGFSITHNTFDGITFQGFEVADVPMHSSAYNIYYNVGTGISPVISFGNPKCISVGDLFERTDAENVIFPRVLLPAGLGGIAFDDTHSIKLGSYERTVGLETIIDTPEIPIATVTTGLSYKITTPGTTDFTLIGASSNAVGTVFTTTNGVQADGTFVPGVEYEILLTGGTIYELFGSADSNVGTIFTATDGIETGGAFISGESYTITTLGTINWTSIGAPTAATGVTFIYNGVAVTGTGAALANNANIGIGTGTGIATQAFLGTGEVALNEFSGDLFTLTGGIPHAYRIDYRIDRFAAQSRMGTITVGYDGGLNVSHSEDFTETSDVAVIFSVDITTTSSTVKATALSIEPVTINYSVVRID